MLPTRREFRHEGRLIYEWLQTIDEVRIFVRAPPGVRAREVECVIAPTRVTLKLKGSKDRYLDHELAGSVVVDESYWTMDGDGEIEIGLRKMRKAETWESVFKGHDALNPLEKMEVQKKMTLERFQEEHKGFDFSSAEFSGAPPDPREFLGGVKYE